MTHMTRQPDLLRDIDRTLANIRTVIEAKRGLLGPDAIEAYDRMKKIDSSETRAALADQLVTILSRRLQESWPVLYESLRLIRDFEIYKQPEWLSGRAMEPFSDFETYFINRMGKPFDLFVEMEETYHFAHDHHPKWKNEPFAKANEARNRWQKTEETRLGILNAVLNEGVSKDEASAIFDVTIRRVEQILEEFKLRNETSIVDVSFRKPIRETKPEIAAKNGISRYQQHKIDKIAKHSDLQQSVDAGNLSVAKAYDVAMEREGKPRDRVSPILRMFDKLGHEEQIRTARAIITKLGWEEEYNHGS